MKRIVDGVAYNTETSTALGMSTWGDKNDTADGVTEGILYQTKGGAFFVHEERTRQVWNARIEQMEERSDHSFIPLSAERAQNWMMTGDVEVIHNPFEDPPEAVAEEEPSSTLYIRMPQSLKARVDAAAKEAKVSANVWAMRCLENCLSKKWI